MTQQLGAVQGPYFGDFGGRYVPEALVAALDDLTEAWERLRVDSAFTSELDRLARTYSGRPSILTEAPKFARHAGGARVLLKREDLNHTGSHKINNVLGQALLTQTVGKTRVIAETGAGQHGVATATAAALLGLPDGLLQDYRGGHILARVLQAMSRRDGFDELSIGDDDLGEQAFGVAGDLIDVEGDEFVAGLHGVARGDVGGETLAAERDRLEADVDEYFQTVRGADGQGVPSRLEIGDLAVYRGEERVAQRIDGKTVTHHLLCEYRIRNVADRHHDARQRGNNVDLGCRLTHGGLPSRIVVRAPLRWGTL